MENLVAGLEPTPSHWYRARHPWKPTPLNLEYFGDLVYPLCRRYPNECRFFTREGCGFGSNQYRHEGCQLSGVGYVS